MNELRNKVAALEKELREVRDRIDRLSATAVAEKRYAVVDRSRCTGCGICERVCLHAAIRVDRIARIDRARCVGCGACVGNCPRGALSLVVGGSAGID
ncbi:MAG: 4Fe-4S binding protein [Planctomycetota bacterium]